MNIKRQKLPTTVGMEVTFQSAHTFPEFAHETAKDTWENLTTGRCRPAFYRRMNERNVPGFNVSCDPQVVEIQTPVRKTKAAILADVRLLREVAAETNMVPVNHYFSTGGGCHIHIGYRDGVYDIYKLCAAVSYLTYKYPVLCWAFYGYTADSRYSCAQPGRLRERETYSDEQIAAHRARVVGYENLIHRPGCWDNVLQHRHIAYEMREARRVLARARLTNFRAKRPARIGDIVEVTAKNFSLALRETYGTIEFRCMRMPDTMAQHKAQLDFACAFFPLILETANTIDPDAILDCKPPAEYTYPEAAGQFYDLLVSLGLDPRRYACDFDNMLKRYQHFSARREENGGMGNHWGVPA